MISPCPKFIDEFLPHVCLIFGCAGCLPTNDLRAPSKIHVSGVNDTVNAVSYKELMEKLPALVRLVQAARRVNDASLSVTSVSNSERMDTIALKASRRARRHLELYRSATAFAAALNEVCQRMGESRLIRSIATTFERRRTA